MLAWIIPCGTLAGAIARGSPSTRSNFFLLPSPGQSRNSSTVIREGASWVALSSVILRPPEEIAPTRCRKKMRYA